MCVICDNDYSVGLTDLDLKQCSLVTSIPDTLVELTFLRMSNTNIVSLPNTLVKLTSLNASDAKSFTTIPDTLVNLESINCDNTSLESISDKFVKLKNLWCANSKVKIIPDTLVALESLDINDTSIETIPGTLSELMLLECKGTPIKSLPKTLGKLSVIHTDLRIDEVDVSGRLISYNNNGIINYKAVEQDTFTRFSKKYVSRYNDTVCDRMLNCVNCNSTNMIKQIVPNADYMRMNCGDCNTVIIVYCKQYIRYDGPDD
jgi:Leucine-rich repeat (LRR) protein